MDDPRGRRDGGRALRRIGIAAAVFAVVLVVHARSPVRTPTDSAGSVPLAVALVTERSVDVSTVLPESAWRGSYLYERRADGAVVNRYPVGPVLLAVPVVAAADLAGVDVRAKVRDHTTFPEFEATLASVVVALTAALLFLLAARRLGRTVPAIVVAVVFAFGTSAWSTASRALWQHGPVMLLFTVALLVLADAPGGPHPTQRTLSTGRLAAAGVALGAAVWCRPVALLVLVVFAAWALLRYRHRGIWLAVGGLVPVVLLAGFGALAFDDPDPLRYPQQPRLALDVIARGLAANLVSPGRGLLVYTPVVLVAVAGLVVGLRRRTFGDLEWCALAAGLVLLGGAAANPVWWAGHAYGPRLLTDVLPFVAVVCLPVAACWPRSARSVTPAGAAAMGAVALLALWGVAVHARGAFVDETWAWNTDPVTIDEDTDRAWDWSQPQFLGHVAHLPIAGRGAPPRRNDATAATSSPAGGGCARRTAVHVLENADLTRAGNRFARALDAAGVAERGGVALIAGNVPEFFAVYRGTQWSGRRFTPMSTRWSADDVAYVVGNCEADVLVAEARYADVVAGAAAAIAPERRFAFGGSIPGFRDWSEVEAFPDDDLPHPVAGNHMMYTSGTTGRPKGVLRPGAEGPPPGRLGQAGMEMLQWCLGDEADGPHLVCTPLYHAAPITYSDGAALLGARLVLLERFEPETVLRAIEEHRIASTFMVPTQFVRLLKLPEAVRRRYDVSSLRLVVHGAAPVAPDIKRAMIDWFGPVLFEFYGGTEGGGLMITSEEWLAHPGAVGRPRNELVVDILDDAGTPVPTGTPGQVWFGGYTRFAYKDDPAKTEETWRDDRFTLGDIGYLDDDGYLYLCDRRADVIISGGVNIYPAQIEAVLLTHPAVADCCVVGVPDDEWGESVRAVVQATADTVADDALAEALLAHCKAGLAAYQVPRAVDFDPALPRTETGKLGRRTVRDRYWTDRTRKI